MNNAIFDLAAATSEAQVTRISQGAFDFDQTELSLTQNVVAQAWKRFPEHAYELALLPHEEGAKLDLDALQAIGLAIYKKKQRKRRRREELVPWSFLNNDP